MTFKPTHRLQDGTLLELEHKFFSRLEGLDMGLFHVRDGAIWLQRMDCVIELPKVIQVSSYEEPEPLLVPPEKGTTYWVVDATKENGIDWLLWSNDATDLRLLAAGEVRATAEDAHSTWEARQKARGFTS